MLRNPGSPRRAHWRALGILVATALCTVGLSAPSASGATTTPDTWANQPPAGTPLPLSAAYTNVSFTGRYASYQSADTWYPSWATNGELYSPYMDGSCNGAVSLGGYLPAGWDSGLGGGKISGSDPLNLSITECRVHNVSRQGWDGRYASASIVKNGVWYYGTYVANQAAQPGAPACNNYCTVGGFMGFQTSTDYGQTWSPAPASPLFGESTANGNRVKLGALHFVDFGQNMQHSPDGYAYLVGHGGGGANAINSWVSGDEIYLIRVALTPQNANNPAAYQFYAGQSNGQPVWSNSLSDLRPLLSWPRHLGSVTITYDQPLNRYLMWVSTPRDGVNTTGWMDSMLLESTSLTGTWRLVSYLPDFGTQGYFLTVPSKFISADGRTMWLMYSANYSGSNKAVPAGSGYAMVVRELTLDTTGSRRLEAERGTLTGGAAFNDSYGGYTGAGFTAGFTAVGAGVSFEVYVPAGGSRTVTLRYANGNCCSAAQTMSLSVNGQRLRQTSLAQTGGWANWADKAEAVTLVAGWNTIAYSVASGDTGWVNLDSIRL